MTSYQVGAAWVGVRVHLGQHQQYRQSICLSDCLVAGCCTVRQPACIAASGREACSSPRPPIPALQATVLLDEGELGAHRPERAATWLAAAPPLFPHLGLQLASHFARLMPLLLGWCLSPRQAVRLAALQALLLAVRQTWPRVGVHAPTLWRVLLRVHEDELRYRCVLRWL